MAAPESSHSPAGQETGSRREQKKRRTHQRLMDSAWQLFQERGYDQTTVEDITRGADVAKSTFFNYFHSKQAILDEVALWQIDVISRQVLSGTGVPHSALARIKLVMHAVVDALQSEQELLERAFLFRLSARGKHEGAHRLGSIIHKLVLQGQAEQEIRAEMDARLISGLLMTCFFHSFARHGASAATEQGASQANADPQIPEPDRDFSRSIDALMSGLGGPDWRKS